VLRSTPTIGAVDSPPAMNALPDADARRRAMRIAFVTETYPPEVNGVATTVARFVDGLLRRRHQVQLVRPRQHAGDVAVEIGDYQEVLVHGLPIPGYPQLRMGLASAGALQRLWSRDPPDVVHVATEGPLGWAALQAARRLGVAVTSDFRTNFHAYSRHYGVGWLSRPIAGYLRRFHNRAACTLVPTEALKRELGEAGFERLEVVPRGVDLARFNPARRDDALRRQWGAGPQDVVLGCVGRLAPEKNLGVAIAAYDAVRRERPAARLVFVGDGPLRGALQARCGDAVFAGPRSGRDLAAHYASFDLFVFPSLTETFGNVTVEAMASGLAVLAFDHAAAGVLIRSGDNGWLVPCGDADAFARRAAAHAGDAARLRAVGQRARSTALAHGWDSVVTRFEAQLAAAGEAGAGTGAALPLQRGLA
jgi:glycosyltransferase involved in cell wall biosynthesis